VPSLAVKLARDGGVPIRSTYLPYGKQSIDDSDVQSVASVLKSDWLTRGPKVKEFEEALASYCEMPFAIAFQSATAGLHAAMALLGASSGKSVAVPAITFAATSNAALYCGADVKFVDVRADTLNIDESKIPSGISIVAAVDFAGNSCDYTKIKTDAPVLVDAAHSLGGKFQGRPVGAFGDVVVLSFHPVKSMTTGEGGAVLVRDPAQAEFLRRFKNHGIVGEIEPGYSPQEFLGYNYHMTEMQAALGVSQLKKLDRFVSRRQAVAEFYLKELKKFSALELPRVTAGAESAWHLFPVRLRLEQLNVDRLEFLKALRAENIGAQVHYMPVYWHPHYQKRGYQKGLCPVAEAEYQRELSIPIFADIREDDLRDVLRAFDKLLNAFAK
jgi:perosamine synthetase